jgi:hypothetical protein
VFETKLAMRLQSGEPKCVNCKFWLPIGKTATVGACDYTDNLRFLRDAERVEVHTTDLSVCSKWEMKA